MQVKNHHRHKDLWVRHIHKIYYLNFTVRLHGCAASRILFPPYAKVAFILDDLLDYLSKYRHIMQLLISHKV